LRIARGRASSGAQSPPSVGELGERAQKLRVLQGANAEVAAFYPGRCVIEEASAVRARRKRDGSRREEVRMKRASLVAASVAFVVGAASAEAGVPMQKKAKELGLTMVQNCQSCHVEKMPKKDSAAVNEMGQWLIDQKQARKAKEIDVAWLKDWKPKAK
jgi:hypothetical protein